ncbi:hypothetical protein V5E97_05950 [Singulisphaera sp. Ch08]|uniref:Uncharacterized protein n=1 Tax=Singulisphaera sp. Ch08 TaxID=3120278 RepID=A0AAU7CK73_9BACT
MPDRIIADPDRMIRHLERFCECPMPLQFAGQSRVLLEKVFPQDRLNPIGS